MADVFRALPGRDRELLALVAWEGLSVTEIATVLGCSRNAVSIRLHRARRRVDGLEERIRALAPDGVDAALDGAGGNALDVSLNLVKDRSRITTLVDHARAPELGIRTTPPEKRSASRVAEAARFYAEGRLHIHVRATFPLEHAADAHREIATGHGRGKAVLLI